MLSLAIGWDLKPFCPFSSCFQHISCSERFSWLFQNHLKKSKVCFPILFNLMDGLTDTWEDTSSTWCFPWASSNFSVSFLCESTTDSEVSCRTISLHQTHLLVHLLWTAASWRAWEEVSKGRKTMVPAELVKSSSTFNKVSPGGPLETNPHVTPGLPEPWCAVLQALPCSRCLSLASPL